MDGIVFINDRFVVEQAFLGFYSHLWSNSSNEDFTSILNALSNDLPKLSIDMCDLIILEVTCEEVYNVVMDLPLSKSLGPDGLNAEFFHFFWLEIGDHMYSAVRFFFSNSVKPPSWGNTFVALIPKNDNPQLIFVFRSISLCNVYFKVISKILAIRLKVYLHQLIGKEQASFVSGRYPFENIIYHLIRSISFFR